MAFKPKKVFLAIFLFSVLSFVLPIIYSVFISTVSNLSRLLKDTVPDFDILNNLHILLGARRDSCINCFSHNYEFVINNEFICHNNVTFDTIILIFTTHQRKLQRKTIRKTWLKFSRNNTATIRYAFILGTCNSLEIQDLLLRENDEFHDILQVNFTDTYNNLTLKTIMAFKWTSIFCRHAKFVMKTDDDVFVNIRGLLHVTKTYSHELQRTIGGYCMKGRRPIRDPNSKWFASYWKYPKSIYPEFCSGTGYVTSLYVVENIVRISKNIPYFHLEDVYVSLCVQKLNFSVQTIRGFYNYPIRNNPCAYKNDGFVTSHQISAPEMWKIWNTSIQTCTRKVHL